MNKPPEDWRNWRTWFMLRPWQRHSLVLMVGGLVYISVGLSFFSIDLTPRTELEMVIALRMFTTTQWGFQFMAVGVLSVLSSRWPRFSESWGYALLCSISSAWSAIFFLGYMLGDAPMSNIIQGFEWALVAFIWWAISGLKNPDRRKVPRDGRR